MKFAVGIVVSLWVCATWAQEDGKLTARQLFFTTGPASPQPATTQNKVLGAKVKSADSTVKKPPTDAASPNRQNPSAGKPKSSDTSGSIAQINYAPLALKFSIMRWNGTSYEEVDPDTQFHSGDHIRVRVEANASAYLYIIQGGPGEQLQVIFPSKDIDDGNNRVQAGKPCVIPSGNGSFYFDETTGVEKVSLVLSRSPERDLERFIYAPGDPTRPNGQQEHKTIIAQSAPVDESVVEHLRGQLAARNLVFEKFDGTAPDGKPEKAGYAATRDRSADAQLFVDLSLVHK